MDKSDDCSVVCAQAEHATTALRRLRGLLGRDALLPEAGMLITPSSGVHTFGMRFAIDVVALDREMRVLGVWAEVAPGRVRALGRRTHSVLELAGGRARACGLEAGQRLAIAPCEPGEARTR